MELLLVKTPGGVLRGADAESQEAIRAWGNGEVITAKTRRQRNIRFHRLFFGMLDMAFANQEEFTNREHFRAACLIDAGYFEDVKMWDGTTQRKALSISFGSMDEDGFHKVYSSVVQVLIDHVFGGQSAASLETELEAFLAAFA
ncbi:MAG: DUF1367 family protein [Gammaproteobacteria bacterium]|nr:DUF1367 family protein [Gammaproteobacteria bacterium]